MNDLYSNNWDSETNNTTPANWVLGSGSNLVVIDCSSNGIGVVSGTNGFGQASNGDASTYQGIAARADMGVKSAQVAHFNGTANMGSVGHILRSAATYTNGAYVVIPKSSDTGATVVLEVINFSGGGGNITIDTSGSLLTVSEGDIYHLYTEIVGDQIDCYLWLDGDAQPGTPSFSVTDSTYTDAGYAGARVNAPNFAFHLLDDYVITDAAAGTPTATPNDVTIAVAVTQPTVVYTEANPTLDPNDVSIAVAVTAPTVIASLTVDPADVTVAVAVTAPTVEYTEAPVPTADAYTLSGPDSGLVDVASGAFTVRSNGTLAADVTITPSDGADGGTFTPSTVTLAAGDFTEATFTYTPASTGAKTISVTNDGSLTDPGDRTFNAVDTLGGFFPVLARRRGRR